MAELVTYTVWVPTLILVIFRVAGIFLTAPMLSSPVIPPFVKAAISIIVGLAATARLAAPVPMPATWVALVLGVGREMLIGGVLGYAASLLFVGVNIAGQHMGQQMGIGLANVYNPQAESTTGVLAAALNMVALVIFLTIGGHRLMLSGLMDTFATVPLMGFAVSEGILEILVYLLAASFALAVKVAAPVLVTLMLSSVAMGLIQRAMPQFNILSAGFQIRVMVSLIILAVSLAALIPLVEAGWDLTMTHMAKIFPAPPGP